MPRPLPRLVLCLSLWCLLAAGASAQGVLFRHAIAVESNDAAFPLDADPHVVALPDDWAVSRPRDAGPVWYRIAFDAAGAHERGEPLALYAERVCAAFEVWLNGTQVHRDDPMRPAATRHCHEPELVALPAPLLRAQANQVDVKLIGRPLASVASRQRAAYLSPLELGLHAPLAERHARATRIALAPPQMASAALAVLGVLMLVLGGASRRARHAGFLGLLALAWAALVALRWWQDVPLSSLGADALRLALLAGALAAGVLFLAGGAGRWRPVTALLVAQCVLAPASLWLAGEQRVFMTATAWATLFGIEAVAAMVLHVWRRWRAHDGHGWLLALLLLGFSFLAGLEFVAQQRALEPAVLLLSQLGMPALFVAAGAGVLRRHAHALLAAEQGRMSLESSIRSATAEIERNFAQLAELRVEQVTERERKRIAADLHDDLGAKLLTIVHTSESERISTLAREALEEMRLSVRGLTGKPVRLIDALGDWRAEVVSRLAQAGVEADWVAPAEDLPQTLSARAYVQTTRILREAVSNIIKHSAASHCSVRSTIAEGDFQLVIQDNGRGIPLELDGRLDRGHGMSSMKHRAKQLQGQCLVESGPGYGTVIRLTLPLEPHAANA